MAPARPAGFETRLLRPGCGSAGGTRILSLTWTKTHAKLWGMKRFLLLPALLLVFLAAGVVAPGSALAVQSCSDSWGSDGHVGPWFTSGNATLHGNTLTITCPSGSVAWTVDYVVDKQQTSGSTIFSPISETRSGHGSTSFSISASPLGCSSGWNYWTHVHNVVTGGTIEKPASHNNVIC